MSGVSRHMDGGAETNKRLSGPELVETVQALSLPGETCPAWGLEVDQGHSHPCGLEPSKQRGKDQDEEFVYFPLTVVKVVFY